MRRTKALHLSDIDPERTAESVTRRVYARAQRDAARLGMAFGLPSRVDAKTPVGTVLNRSRTHKAARMCAEWAVTGKGAPEEVAAALRELRADLEGIEPGEASGEPDLSTPAGVVLVAAAARLALVEGRAVDAKEVATLASVDERSIRAAAGAGTLPPVGTGRPMRFAATVVRQYLYTRGVAGFGMVQPSRAAEPPLRPN
jgi:hypothetical protein